MPDVERLTRKLERRKSSLSDLCQLYRASSKLPMIQAALLDHPGAHAELLRTRSLTFFIMPAITTCTTGQLAYLGFQLCPKPTVQACPPAKTSRPIV